MPNPKPFSALKPPEKMPHLGLMLLQEGECPYLSDRRPTLTAICAPQDLSEAQMSETLAIGMRRSGALLYRPICEGCRKCFALRIKVSDFVWTHSQKRVLKRCNPLFVSEFERASLTYEKVSLYQRYQQEKHGETMTSEEAALAYENFLVQSCTETFELRWRTKEGRLVGVGVLDVSDTALSSVYFYWDLAYAHFSLGTFSVLKEIELARKLGLEHYYLGYYVPGSPPMAYKAQFGPCEIFNGSAFEPLDLTQLDRLEASNTLADAERFDLATRFSFDEVG